jgi:thymidine kinase
MIARRGVQVFKPRIDNRYSGPEIATHCNLRMPSESIDSVEEIVDRLASETQLIGVDEAHFFGEPLVEVATQLADSGVQVIVAGLDTDYMGRPFPPMPDLLALAESITKTLAIWHALRSTGQTHPAVSGIGGTYFRRSRRFVRSPLQTLLRTGNSATGTTAVCVPRPQEDFCLGLKHNR